MAHDLRFAPAAAARRHTQRAERLAGIIDPRGVYPEDFVVYQITGFRPEIPQPELIPGDALLHDLGGLLDRLSRRAGFKPQDLGPPEWLTTADLLARWKVSRKTLERLRTRGLIGRRVTLSAGRAKNVFDARLVAAVEAREGLGEGKRARPRTDARPVADSPTSKGRPRLSPKARRVAERASRAGVGVVRIARGLETSTATVLRVSLRALAEKARAVKITVPEGAAALVKREGDRFLREPVVRTNLPSGTPAPLTVAEHVAETLRLDKPDPQGERALAFAYWTLVERAQRAARGVHRTRPSALALDRIVTDLRWAALLKIELMRREQRLVLRTIEVQVGMPILEVPPDQAATLLTQCNAALRAAVDRFDPASGRLAGVAGLELSRAVSRWLGDRARTLAQSARSHAVSTSPPTLDDWRDGVSAWQMWTNPMPLSQMQRRLEHLSLSQRELLTYRHGLGGSPPQDVAELGHRSKKPARVIARLVRIAERELFRAGTLPARSQRKGRA